jgi:TM2 domain-containing membrane protein YozV
MKLFSFFLTASAALVVFTSAVQPVVIEPVKPVTVQPVVVEPVKPVTTPTANMEAVKAGLASNDFKQMKSAVETLKGSELTFKERLALRIFKKKISQAALNDGTTEAPQGTKSQLVALLLCGFLGGLGIHRFYLGYTWQGIVQLLTAGGCGIWALIDFIRIITGDLKPKDGNYDKTL